MALIQSHIVRQTKCKLHSHINPMCTYWTRAAVIYTLQTTWNALWQKQYTKGIPGHSPNTLLMMRILGAQQPIHNTICPPTIPFDSSQWYVHLNFIKYKPHKTTSPLFLFKRIIIITCSQMSWFSSDFTLLNPSNLNKKLAEFSYMIPTHCINIPIQCNDLKNWCTINT